MANAHRTLDNPFLLITFLLVGVSSLGLLTTPYYVLAPLPPVFVGLIFLLARRPLLGYYLILFAIPLDQYRTLSEQFPSLTVSKIVGILLIAIILLRMLLTKASPPRWTPLITFVGLFLVVNSISVLFSSESVAAIDGLRQLITSVVFLGITLVLVDKSAFFGILPKVIVLSVCLGALLSVYGYFFDSPMFAMNVASDDIKRGVGAANNPNHFALTLLFAFPLLVHYLLAYNPGRWRLLASLLSSLSVLALVLTFSRGAALNFVVMLLLLCFEYKRYLRPRTLGFAISGTVAVLVLSILLTPGAYWERQRSMLDTSDSSVSRRFDYIQVGWESFLDGPLLGSGPDSFRYRWEAAVKEGVVAKGSGEHLKRYAHNTYLEVLIGSGLFGLLLFLAIVVTALKAYSTAQRRLVRQGEAERASLVGAYKLSFVSLLVYFLMLSSQFHKYFWISLAFSQLALFYSDNQETDDA